MNTHIANTLVESWSNWFFLSSNHPPPHIINNRLVKFDSLSRVSVGSWRLSTGFLSIKSKTISNVSCGCSSNNSSNGLEAEILEFMTKSRNPHAFPSKKDLLNAGRKDLVLAILKEGGYLAYGWDNSNDNDFDSKFIMSNDDNRVVDDTCLIGEDDKEEEEEKEEAFVVSNTSSYSASSSGRSMETAVENDSGIDGILSRLRNERSKSFALDLAKRRINGHKKNSAANSTRHGKSSKDVATWSIPKANAKFEAANSSLAETKKGTQKFSGGEILKTIEGGGEPVNGRLQRLNSEISSILSPLRSNSQEIDSLKENENSTYMYPTVSDSWEFQENTIMNASDKLRSLRAKTAVLEGKLTLATAYALFSNLEDLRKKIDERQKRIDCARAALNLLRTACIFWTSPADEVFLTGSFDGWSTQRKMEKSGAGIFSLTLQLYPGRHEIKFIVDGEWRIDPLRPVVNNDGHKNNLLGLSLVSSGVMIVKSE
ncbi:hypothetical protein ACFE04_024869 [Oxalis oulophora]